jgi:hypothetical protein
MEERKRRGVELASVLVGDGGKAERLGKMERRRLCIDLGHLHGLDLHRQRTKEIRADDDDCEDDPQQRAEERERLSHRREPSIGF